ncbi:MAG: hypothetical protein RIT27_785 [Pseudomonadota bacterium]|jgi:hypothetical protein
MIENTLLFIRNNLSVWQSNNLNEAQTCQAIILRILQDLHYDIWNPLEVFPQDTNTKGAGRPDYLICLEEQEKFVIEVKALNKEFSDAEYTQTVNYVNAKGLRWAILTNGIQWLFFDNLLKGTIKQKLALELNINEVYFGNYLNLLLNQNNWVTQNAHEEMTKKISLIHITSWVSKKSKFYAKTEEGLEYLIEREFDHNQKQLAKEYLDFLRDFYLNGTVQFFSSKNKPKPLSQTPLQNTQESAVDLFVGIISNFKENESSRNQVKIKVHNQELAFFSWKSVYFAIAETLVQLNKIQALKGVVEEDERDLNTYPKSAYKKLSNGKHIYIHYSAKDHQIHIKQLLEILGIYIEIIYKDNPPILLP